ncbi:MAG: hypothetical protein EAX96_16970 [Candidatus Lokiarchaeota archaeon]|nr:hypothetical protein [Candidatus Lokiarchaeota archaeon]
MNARDILKNSEYKIENALEAKENKRLNEAVVLFDEILEELRSIKDSDEALSSKYDEIKSYSIQTKKELKNDLLEKIEFLKSENKIPLIVEHYEIILNLSEEIGEAQTQIDEYRQNYKIYRKQLNAKILQNIQDLINEANDLKNLGNFSEAKNLFENALNMACEINNEDLIWALTEQVRLINDIYLKEKRKKNIELAGEAIESENYSLAISLYKIAAKYSVELGELEPEREFLAEVRRLEREKEKYEKQRKKIEEKIITLIERADNYRVKNSFFEAIKLYYEALSLNPSEPQEIQNKIMDTYLEYTKNLFYNDKLPETFREVISIATELSLTQGKISIHDLYERAAKRILKPKEQIASVIYFLHRIRILF